MLKIIYNCVKFNENQFKKIFASFMHNIIDFPFLFDFLSIKYFKNKNLKIILFNNYLAIKLIQKPKWKICSLDKTEYKR